MPGIDHDTAIGAYPCLTALASLTRPDSGWLFLPPLMIGGVECLFGVHGGPVVTETIVMRSPDDVTVARLRTEDFMARTGATPGVLWEFTGLLEEAVERLTDLPPDEHPAAPRLLKPSSSMFVTPKDC